MSRLAELNVDIQQRLQRVNLFVELNDDEAFYNELKAVLEQAREHMTPQQIAKNLPYAVSYFLVLHGMFHYRGGDFWQGALNLDTNHRVIWSQMFLEVLRQNGMPRFERLVESESALRYITPILMHGGIPRYSLPDFFREFLTKYMRTARRSNIPLMQYKNDWLEQPPAIDKPVVRFLGYGGSFASEWVEQTIQMAALVDDAIRRNRSSAFLSQSVYRDASVPTWVTQAYWEYRKTRRTSDANAQTIVQPRLTLTDDYKLGIELPIQELMITASNNVQWNVEYGISGQPGIEQIPVFAHIRGNLLHTEASSTELRYLEDLFGMRISLLRGGEIVQEWTYEAEKFLFRRRGTQYVLQMRREPKLPNTPVMLVAQQQHELVVDGVLIDPVSVDAALVFRFDPGSADHVVCDGVAMLFAESEEDLQPYLSGGNRVGLIQPVDMAVAYAGLPDIHLPLSRNAGVIDQQAKWRIYIFNETTHEAVRSRIRLSDCIAAIQREPRALHICIAQLAAVYTPGLYRIELTSETQTARLYFIYVPGMIIERQTSIVVPLLRTERPQILITAFPDHWACLNDSQRVNDQQQTVLSFPEGTEAALIELGQGERTISMAVVFPHVHVKIYDKTGTELSTNMQMQKDIAWYQETLPVIEASVSPWNAPDVTDLRIQTVVEVAQNDTIHVLNPRSNATRRWFIVDTAAANDTIVHSLGGNAQVMLSIGTEQMNTAQPLLTLQKMVHVENLSLSWAPVGEKFRVSATWEEPESPSNWRFVFWSLQRPWENIDVRPIAGNQRAAKYIVSVDDFRAGEKYLVGIVSVNRTTQVDELASGESSSAPAFPPDSRGYSQLEVPGPARLRSAEDYIAALFTGVAPNAALLQQLFDKPRNDIETRIKVNYRLLLRMHQQLMHMHRSDELSMIQDVMERELRAIVRRYYLQDPLAFVIATMKLANVMRQFTVFDRELVQYLADVLSQDLFDVLFKREIRGGVCASHFEVFLHRALTKSDELLLRKHGIFLTDEYDEPFVVAGVTDDIYWHGIPRGMVHPDWLDAMNAPQELSYEDAVLATSRPALNQASVFGLHTRKLERIRDWRERLMPIIQVWLLRTLIEENISVGMAPAPWWQYVGQDAVLRKLNAYTVDRGDLRDYLEAILRSGGRR
jgi:hypothetical protein